jgi:hypothetical protein
MEDADAVLADEDIVAAVYEALARRHAKSRSRGRRGVPAETVLRLLILKHVRNWSYEVLEREVRANLVYRDFTRVGALVREYFLPVERRESVSVEDRSVNSRARASPRCLPRQG